MEKDKINGTPDICAGPVEQVSELEVKLRNDNKSLSYLNALVSAFHRIDLVNNLIEIQYGSDRVLSLLRYDILKLYEVQCNLAII